MKSVPWLVVALALALGALPARVLAESSSGTIRLYSALLPGLGHVVAGDASKGLTLMSIYAGSLTLALATGPWTWEKASTDPFFGDLAEGTPTSTKLIFGGAAAVTVGTWIYAITDAPHALRRVTLGPQWTPEGPALALHTRF